MDSQDSPSDDFAHGGRTYLNNASVSIQPHQSIRAMSDFVTQYCHLGPDSSASEEFVTKTMRSARLAISKMINCEPDELAFTQSTTDGVNIVARGMRMSRDSNVLIRGGAHEHHSNYYAWLRLAPNVEVRNAPIDKDGLLADSIDNLTNSDTALVSLSHALYNTGAILPIEDIGARLRELGIPFFVDAAQTVGCMGRMDVHKMGCDFMAFNGSKWLCGPMGTGIFYCRRGSEDLLEPLGVGGESAMIYDETKIAYRPSPERFQAGFRNYAGVAAMASSVQYLENYGLEKIRQKVTSLATRLRNAIEQIPGAVLYGPEDESARTSIVPFTLEGKEPAHIVEHFESRQTVLAVREILDKKLIRVSPHFFNTREQIDTLASELAAL